MNAVPIPEQSATAADEFGKCLIFNGRVFTPLAGQPLSDACGFFKLDNAGIHLYKPSREVAAYLVANPAQGYFAVTVVQYGNQVRYMFACTTETEAWLGTQDMPMSVEHDLIRNAARQVR